ADRLQRGMHVDETAECCRLVFSLYRRNLVIVVTVDMDVDAMACRSEKIDAEWSADADCVDLSVRVGQARREIVTHELCLRPVAVHKRDDLARAECVQPGTAAGLSFREINELLVVAEDVAVESASNIWI